MDRVVQREHDDGGAEAYTRREARNPAERDQRRIDAAVGVDRFGPDEDVLGGPDRVEPQLLRGLGCPPDPVRSRALAEVRQDDPEMHDSIVLRARVAESRVARLATIDPDGRPHLVPIVFAVEGDTLYSAVDAKPKRSRTLRRIENARHRPDVAVLVDHYEDDWSLLWWVRLRGHARVLDGGEEATRALALLTAKYERYRESAPGLPVLAIDVDEWRDWSAER
jgi:PPOX class probable F420-dependent enzyme